MSGDRDGELPAGQPTTQLQVGDGAIELLRELRRPDGAAWAYRDPFATAEGTVYDRRAAAYDRLMRNRLYHRLAWGSSPGAYTRFARVPIAAGGRLLDVGCGTIANLADEYRARRSAVVLVDRSAAMLELASRRLERCAMPHALVVADVSELPFAPAQFEHVLAHGLLHLFDDAELVLAKLVRQLRAEGTAHVSMLTGARRRGRIYLRALARAGEVAPARSPAEVEAVFAGVDGAALASFELSGCMAFARLRSH